MSHPIQSYVQVPRGRRLETTYSNWALEFLGTAVANTYVNVPHDATLNINHPYCEAWVYPATYVGDNRRIISKGGNYLLWLDVTGVFGFLVGAWLALDPTAIPYLDRWYHVKGIHDGAEIYLIVNGLEVDRRAAVGNATANNNPLHIGRRSPAGDDWFHGLINEVRVGDYDTVGEGDNESFYRGYARAQFSDRCVMRMEEASGNTVFDSSLSGNNGTRVNNPAWIRARKYAHLAQANV